VSDNVLLQGRGSERADVLFRTSPSLDLRRTSGRFRFNGSYSPVILGFLNDSLEESVFNNLRAKGTYELVDGRAFIEATGSMSQVFFSPFGSQPSDVATGSINRTELRTFSVSPYVQGLLGDGGRYRLRSDNSYTSFSAGPSFTFTTNGVAGEVSGARNSLVSLGANASHSMTSFGADSQLTSQSATVRATLNADREFVPYVTGGYEYNEFFLATFQGARYGGGFVWRPSPRTTVDLSTERRYFGTSFKFDLSHRTRLGIWSLTAYRTDRVTPAGGGFGGAVGPTAVSTREVLSDLLRGRFADEAERQIEVQRLISSGQLPSTLSQQAAIASPRVLLIEGVEPRVALTGARNTGLASIFWRRSRPLSGNGGLNAQDVFNLVEAFDQVGASLTWSHRFTQQTSASTGVDWFDIRSSGANALQPSPIRTEQTVYRLFLTQEIAAGTTATAGLRFTRFEGEASGTPTVEARERAIQFGVVHKFF
jgi:uncharacterized protein (PEP-CTERM system associated)